MKKEVAQAAGIDMKAGVRAFANNRIIYDRFLLGFAENEMLKDAKNAMDEGDLDQARDLLEQLGGLTKKLGILEYSKSVEELLAQLNEDAGDEAKVSEAFANVKGFHDKVMEAFEA